MESKNIPCNTFVQKEHQGRIFIGTVRVYFADKRIKEIVVTNTIEIPDEKIINKIKVLSVAGLFSNAIRRIHIGESVGALFK
ncbi:MAG: hypothetical protein JRF62_13330 [Deltaproteobacteria bacterium]|nr:hypothetical protein [Deltaproteobacteria bacterium]MBW2248140.1 hypothetical protein [Deltaproteobacteria bacterium]MBW2641105.1 hypothetical protein [Deltaproteobacteria bacterium]MBW2681632.1 hypothetical protein [Deltaproteobacteria bacterium]